jgi:predicted MFS family arabinose efflux permease
MSALACKYGKRPVFIFSSIMGVIGTVLGGVSTDYHSLKTGRIISGFATSAYESIVIASIGDLYFVHQRGFRPCEPPKFAFTDFPADHRILK